MGDEELRARQHGRAFGRVPTRAHPGELRGELGAVGFAIGEEELELEQVAQASAASQRSSGSTSSTSSTIALSTKWWIAELR